MSGTGDTVLVEDDGGVRTVTLNRPHRLNAINDDLMRDLNAALAAAQADPGVAAIVLTGAGRAFCAGDDLVDQQEQDTSDLDALRGFLERLQDITRNIMLGETPVVAAVAGWAVGGAFSWPMNADLSVWEAGARGFFPELAHGLFVSGGMTFLLPQWTGGPAANDILYSGDRYDAETLHARGLVSRVAPAGEGLATARSLAERIAGYPAAARAAMKRTVIGGFRAGLVDALDREVAALMEVMVAGDWRERTAANFPASGKG
jgi:enoyl-CoA hydratase/carnithine racemase